MTEELREDGWTPDEHHCYQACRAIARDGAPLSVEHARELIEATRAVFERNHSSSTQRLNKSSHITRALRLMSSSSSTRQWFGQFLKRCLRPAFHRRHALSFRRWNAGLRGLPRKL